MHRERHLVWFGFPTRHTCIVYYNGEWIMSSTARKRKRDEDSKDLDEQERRLLAQFCAIQAAM